MSDYGSCNLVECPDEYLFDAEGQVCRSCDDLDSEEDVTEFQCTKKCDNREIKTTKNGYEVCALKDGIYCAALREQTHFLSSHPPKHKKTP